MTNKDWTRSNEVAAEIVADVAYFLQAGYWAATTEDIQRRVTKYYETRLLEDKDNYPCSSVDVTKTSKEDVNVNVNVDLGAFQEIVEFYNLYTELFRSVKFNWTPGLLMEFPNSPTQSYIHLGGYDITRSILTKAIRENSQHG